MDTEHKLRVLAALARAFRERQVVWAVGASLLLYLKGKCETFHDLDLLVAERDIDAAREACLSLGELLPARETSQYRTRHFLEFVVEGVEIDLIAGFTILHGGQSHYFPLEAANIHDSAEVCGERIPLQSLEEWRHYYDLMGRPEKVALIDGN